MKVQLLVLAVVLFFASCSTDDDTSSKASVSSSTPVASQSTDESSVPEVSSEQEDSSSDIQAEDKTIIQTATITDGAHASSAIINIYSDNSVEVLNFNYDGKAPDVYIAVGNKDNSGNFERVALLSNKIEGAQQDATLMLELGDVTEFNAVSIYCEQYSDDFGSSLLESVG